jgi:2-polyprenyl-6-hydroxyphenyl methylase / 3-demethylubiquinone-9 3-methyltransferase
LSKQYTREELKDLYGQDYVSLFANNKNQVKRIKNICKHIEFNANDIIADVGCGIGLLYDECKGLVKEYHGIDFSESFINAFEKKVGNNVHLHCADVVIFSGQNKNAFTKITTFDFSEHIYDDQFIEIYSALKLSLKRDGELILHTPNKLYFLELLKDWGMMKQIMGHVGVRTAKQHIYLLKKSGFTSVNVRYISHYNVLKKLHFLSYIPIVGRFFKARILIKAS